MHPARIQEYGRLFPTVSTGRSPRARAAATAETETDNIWYQAWTHEDLATVLERAGRIDDAREGLERSLALWERKGCVPCAARVRAQIDTLGRAK